MWRMERKYNDGDLTNRLEKYRNEMIDIIRIADYKYRIMYNPKFDGREIMHLFELISKNFYILFPELIPESRDEEND